MTEDMPRKRPVFIVREKNRHGNWRWYFRRKGHPRVRLPDEYGTEAFWQAYYAALAGKPAPSMKGPAKGTLEWLVRRYKASGHYAGLSIGSRLARDGIYRRVCDKSGHIDFRRITRKKIQEAMDDRAATPHGANNFLVAMSVLFKWAVASELVDVNPCDGVKPRKDRIIGFHTWTMEEVEQYRKRHPVGTKARLAIDLLLFTGLRRSDVVRVGRQHVKDSTLSLVTIKTGAMVHIPIFPELQKSINATKTGNMTFLTTERGNPFSTSNAFGPWFRKRCNEAELPQECTPHGLRKAGATIAANNGATVHELMAMFGWSRSSMAEVYTKAADRNRLARGAAERIANNAGSNPKTGLEPETTIRNENKAGKS